MAAQNKLTDSMLRGCAPCELNDGGGLYFLRKSATQASWYFRYQYAGKKGRKTGLGSYPDVSLKRAREAAQECREWLQRGLDPRLERKERRERRNVKVPTFAEVAQACYEAKQPGLRGKNQSGEWIRQLENHAFPILGKKRCRDITVKDVQNVLAPLWRDYHPTAKKVANRTEQVLKYATAGDAAFDTDATITETRVDRARMLLGHSGHVVEHHDALPWEQAPDLYQALGDDLEHLAFKMYLLTVVRVSPARTMHWDEIQDDTWAMGKGRMKSGRAFNVPLSTAAQVVLKTVQLRYETQDLVFPNERAPKRGVFTENAFNIWLRKKSGFTSTAHGLRSTFRDWCGDNRICKRDIAEMCLDHEVMGATEAAYARSELFLQRQEVLEKWGQYVTGGLDFDSPWIKRRDLDGIDQSLSLNDILEDVKINRNARFSQDDAAVAKWYREDDPDELLETAELNMEAELRRK